MTEIEYKTVLEALLPHGSLWRPMKTIVSEAISGIELITNGTFDTDLSGWTTSESGGGVDWEAPGVMHVYVSVA